jgi:hypothetical protein
VAGAYGYANVDPDFQNQGMAAYAWPLLYLFIISLEMAYGKQVLRSVDLKTKSGPVLYTNLLGIPPMLFLGILAGEPSKFHTARQTDTAIEPFALLLLFVSCAAGIGIGYSSWWCRDKVSATSFTLIGVMNKCLTILLNFFMWDQHAPIGGIASLSLCLVGGAIYQQAPLRPSPSPNVDVIELTKDAWESNMSEPEHHDVEEPLLEQNGIKQR